MHLSETRIFIGFLSFLGRNYLPRLLLENRIQQHPALRNHPATSQARRGAILRTFPTETFGTDFTMSTSRGLGYGAPVSNLETWCLVQHVYCITKENNVKKTACSLKWNGKNQEIMALPWGRRIRISCRWNMQKTYLRRGMAHRFCFFCSSLTVSNPKR